MAFLRTTGLSLFLVLAGCTIDAFTCSDAEQCDLRDAGAVCLEDGACAYADDACPSGFRRSSRAVADPGRCVQEDGTSTSGPTVSTDATSTVAESSTSGAAETCAGVDWYPDADGDGFGDANAEPTTACEAPQGSVDNADDCDDTDSRLRPDHLSCDDNEGLVAWYRLDEPADAGFVLDETSKSVGMLVGDPVLGADGAFGSAVAFAGHPDSIDISESTASIAPDGAPGEEGTVELWAWAEPADESCAEDCARFVLHISDETGDGFGNNTPDLHLHLANSGVDTPYTWRGFVDGAFAGGSNCNLGGPEVAFERWTHLAFRWSRSECSFWVDGTVANTGSVSVVSPPWTRARIGHPPARPDRAFLGRIDEIMVFDYARSNAEIRRDCGRDPCPPG